MDTVDRDQLVLTSSWVYAKDDHWEAKARIVVIGDGGGYQPKCEVLCCRVGAGYWRHELNEASLNELIKKSNLNSFLYKNKVIQEVLDAAVCLFHTPLHELASQNRLAVLVEGFEHLYINSRPLPPGMKWLPPNDDLQTRERALRGPQGPIGYQGPGISMPTKSITVPPGFDVREGDAIALEGETYVVASSSPIPPTPPTPTLSQEERWEIEVPEDFVANSGRWVVVVVADDNGTVVVEHRPDQVCGNTIRYVITRVELAARGRILR